MTTRCPFSDPQDPVPRVSNIRGQGATVLLDDGTGRVRPALVSLLDLLVTMDKPGSGLAWLDMRRGQLGNASRLLRRLGLGEIPLTHDAFHELQPWRAASHLKELLMACGVLPAVDKHLCSFARWLPAHLADTADPEHTKTIRLFATWHVLPGLRARAERSHITPGIRRFASEQIKYATAFLHWLSERNTTLASCGQVDIDAWFAENARTRLRGFLNWAMQGRHCRRSLAIPAMKISRRPALSEDERLAALGRLLTGTEIPMRLRVAGVIVLLYAQPLSRVVRLTIDDVIRDGDTVLLRLGEPPSPVPAPVAALLLEHITNRGNMNTATNPASRWLFPGCRPRPTPRPQPPVRAPEPGRNPDRRRPRRRHPPATPRTARTRRRGRSRLPRQDHKPPPQRDRRNLEPIRRRRSRKVTNRLGTPGNQRSREPSSSESPSAHECLLRGHCDGYPWRKNSCTSAATVASSSPASITVVTVHSQPLEKTSARKVQLRHT